MGISKLNKVKVGKETIKEQYTVLDRKTILDAKVGIDALIVLIQCLTNGPILKSRGGKITLHINTLVNKLLKYPYKQLWVFDNQDKNDLKLKTVMKRKFKSEIFTHIKLSDAVKDFKKILDMVGIKYVTSPPKVEAECYLVELKRIGIIDYILTTDTDVLAYGEDMLVFEKEFKLYKIDSILNNLNLKISEFRKMCVMLGTDFNDKIAGVTFNTILNNLDLPLSNSDMIATYIMFSLRVALVHDKEELEPLKPVFTNDLVKFLIDLDFKNLVEKILNRSTLDI